jgi:hypothetical protein
MFSKAITIFILLVSLISFSQIPDTIKVQNTKKEYDVKDYPEGLYYDMKDFNEKIPNQIIKLERKTVEMNRKIHKDSLKDQVNFYSIDKKKGKIMNVFAISFENNLYFGQKFLKTFSKYDNRFQNSETNSFLRVLKDGNFFYLEDFVYDQSAMSTSAALGYGLVGGLAAAIIISNSTNINGVIYENQEFDSLKNCEKFNTILKEKKSIEIIDCDKSKLDNIIIRKLIDKIIQ